MSLAYELEKLGNLKDSGVITQSEFEQSKNRLLDECVRKIESVHDDKPGANARLELPPVNIVQGTVQHLRFLPAEASPKYAASADLGNRADIRSSSTEVRGINKQEMFQEPQDRQKNDRSARAEAPPGHVSRGDATRLEAAPVKPVRSAVQHIRFLSPNASSQSDGGAELVQQTEAVAASAKDEGVITEEVFAGPEGLPHEAGDRLFKSFDSPKPRPGRRWGLPQVKVTVVRGVVQKITLSQRKPNHQYTASVEVDGQQAEIGSKGSIAIDTGDRVALGGYERNGKLLALAYHNESTGDHADLGRLRKGYRFLLIIGRVSLGAGIAALTGTLLLLLLQYQAGSFNSGPWGYVPYALSGLAGAAVSYLGLGLSFLGSRAKEFHDAMSSSA